MKSPFGLSPLQELASLPEEVAAAWLAEQPPEILTAIARGEWWWVGRPEQQAPPGDWFVWLLLSGRGFGKTRCGSEWLVDRALRYPHTVAGHPTEWLLIAETLSDAMRQCVYGSAGVKAVLERRVGAEDKGTGSIVKTWRMRKTPKPSIELADGQMIYVEGADDEDVGRGYNAAGGWLDEFAKWKKPDGSWTEGIMPSLRADLPGDFPRVVVTTTPKLVVQLVDWVDRTDGTVYVTTGSTYANAANLAAPMLAELHRRYAGTRLGAQELQGLLIREVEGALWSLEWIERDRVYPGQIPSLTTRILGMDPAGSGERDETGLVVAARGSNGEDYVLGDWSKQVAGHEAARRAWEMFRAYSCDWLVIEDNVGKKWLKDVMVQAYKEMRNQGLFPPGGDAPLRMVTAKVGKKLRAEPVAARYEQGGRVHHVRGQKLSDLETQMISWVPLETKDSPDRVDALVYAELMLYGEESREVIAVSPHGRQLARTALSPLGG